MELLTRSKEPFIKYESLTEGCRLRCVQEGFARVSKGEVFEVLSKNTNSVTLTNGRSKYTLSNDDVIYNFVFLNAIERTTYRIDVTVTPQVSTNVENPFNWRILKYTLGEGETLIESGWAQTPRDAFETASNHMNNFPRRLGEDRNIAEAM